MGKNKKKPQPAVEKTELQKLTEELLNLTLQEVLEVPKELLENFGKIYELVEKIRELEKPFSDVPKRTEADFEHLVSWGIQFGCYVKHIVVKKVGDDEFGMFSTETLQDADIFLSVPLDIMMTSDFALDKTPLGPLMKNDPICSQMSNICLSLHLINELAKGLLSFWLPYIRCLPTTYNTILYFKPDDLKLLSGSVTLEESCNLYRSIARQYAYFRNKFEQDTKWKQQPLAQIFTYEVYRWAVTTVMTRQNKVPSLSPGRMQAALIPLWDMCNHSNLRSGTDYDVPSQQLVSFATRAYERGEEVHIFYGNRANSQFFIHNGFVYDDNEYDSISLRLGISKSDSLFEMKKRLCEKLKIPVSAIFELKKTPDGDGVYVPKVLLQLLHILTWKPPGKGQTEQLKEDPPQTEEELDEMADPVRTKNASNFLQTRCALLTKALPHPMDSLKKMLEDPAVSAESKLAIRYRLSENKVLTSAVNKVQFTL